MNLQRIKEHTNQKKLLYILAVLLWFSQYIYIPFQTPYMVAMGVASSVIGVIVGLYGLPQMLLRLPLGVMADRKPRHKFFMTLGATVSGVASAFRILLPDERGFMLGSILSGVASATWVSYLVVYPGFFEKREKATATGHMLAASSLGILVAFILASLTYEKRGMAFLCGMGIVASAVAVLISLFICEPEERIVPESVRKLLSVVKNKRVIVFALFNLVQQGTVASTTLSFTTQIAKSLSQSNLLVGLCSVIYIVTAFISASLTGRRPFDRLGSRVMIPAILLGLFAYCLLVPNVTSIYVLFLVQILAGFSQGMFQSYCTAEGVKDIPEERKSTAMGFYQSIYAIGMTAFPVVMGIMVQGWGTHVAYYIISIFSALSCVGAVVFFRTRAK